MNRKEIAKQCKIKMVNVEPMLEDMVRQFRNDKHSLDIQQLRLITEYLIEDREFDADYIDEIEQELEQEKENNKDLQKQLNGAFDRGFISKDKIKEIYNILGEYRHFSTPTNEQIEQNENAVDKAVNFIKELLEEE